MKNENQKSFLAQNCKRKYNETIDSQEKKHENLKLLAKNTEKLTLDPEYKNPTLDFWLQLWTTMQNNGKTKTKS